MHNIVIIDSNSYAVLGLKDCLQHDQIRIYAVEDAVALEELLIRVPVTLLVMELSGEQTPLIDKLAYLLNFTHRWPGVRIVILTEITEPSILNILRDNLQIPHIISKHESCEEIQIKIYDRLKGLHSFTSSQSVYSGSEKCLSPREWQVLLMLVEGRRQKEIADLLNMSIKTVSTHKVNITRKMGCENFLFLMKKLMQPQAVKFTQTSLPDDDLNM